MHEMDLITPESPQYLLFKDYALAVKEFLDEVLYLKRFSRDKQPNIYYSTPRRAWAKIVQPLVNGFSETPVCVFHLSGLEPKMSEVMGGFVTLTEQHPTNENKLRVNYSPTIWKLTYTTTLWTRVLNDMDTMLSQLLIYTVEPKVWATKVNNVWAELYVENISIEDDLEPGDAKDKTVRRSITIGIRRAYLPREAYDVGRINQFMFEIGDENHLESEII